MLRVSTDPYTCYLVGDVWFPPWEEPTNRKGVFKVHKNYWRTAGGAKWTTKQVLEWAERMNRVARRHYHVPKLIDEVEEARIDRILGQ